MVYIGFDKSEFEKVNANDAQLAPPWNTYVQKLAAIFEGDDQIEVSEPEESTSPFYTYVINITVYSHKKFVALDRALVKEVDFGNVKLGLLLYDAENGDINPGIEVFKDIFEGNPHVKDIIDLEDQTGTVWSYLRFYPEVIQYENDDLSDPYGVESTLAENIADEVFSLNNGMFFTTARNNENENNKVVYEFE